MSDPTLSPEQQDDQKALDLLVETDFEDVTTVGPTEWTGTNRKTGELTHITVEKSANGRPKFITYTPE
mgnify:CR=1 FL=1